MTTRRKENIVKKLLKLWGYEEIAKKLITNIIKSILDAAFIPDDDIESKIVISEINKVVEEEIGTLVSSLINIYCNYFTYQELQQTLLFYQSKIGEKLISSSMSKEVEEESRNWGQRIKPIVEKRVDKIIDKFEEDEEKDQEKKIIEGEEKRLDEKINFGHLKHFFWSLGFEQRNTILSKSGFIPEGYKERLPQTLEHNALMSARSIGIEKLSLLWDNIMFFLLEEQRKPNPYKKEKKV